MQFALPSASHRVYLPSLPKAKKRPRQQQKNTHRCTVESLVRQFQAVSISDHGSIQSQNLCIQRSTHPNARRPPLAFKNNNFFLNFQKSTVFLWALEMLVKHATSSLGLHTIAIDSDGQIYGWGLNAHSQLRFPSFPLCVSRNPSSHSVCMRLCVCVYAFCVFV